MITKLNPNKKTVQLREDIRIIWTLFTKDLVDALKNKNTLVVILSALLMVFFYRGLPALSSQDDPVNLLIYDADNSVSILKLDNSQKVSLYTYSTEEEMKQFLTNGVTPELGLSIPDGFDVALQSGKTPEIQGYVMRWVSEEDAVELRQIVEDEFTALVGHSIKINTEGNRVDMLPESCGLGETASFGLVFVLIMIGVMVIPHLMLEEKQNRTIDMLSVSPASAVHIVAGKVLAGLFYCSLGGIVALVANRVLVVHWGLALLTVLIGSLFTVSLGLWLGIKIDSRAQLSMWSWVILLPLIMPIIFSLLSGLVPDPLVRAARYIPSTAIFDLSRISFANPVPIGRTLLLLAWVASAAGVVLAGVVWTLHRRDREVEVFSTAWQSSLPSQFSDQSRNLFEPLRQRISNIHLFHREAVYQISASMGTARSKPGRRSSLSMILAIAAKDMVDALKNRLILSILLGSIFILLSGAALPALLSANLPPLLVIYDQGDSTVPRDLVDLEDYRVRISSSQEEMEAVVGSSSELALGLILPAGFDELLNSGQNIELQAYFPHWAKSEPLAQREGYFEEQLSETLGTVIHLNVTGHGVYPGVELSSRSGMLLLNLVMVILVIGIALVPLLLIEEKETQTLKVLLISPASMGQVILGKALVGLFYSLLPALVIMLFYHFLFVHWVVAILAVILTASVAVVTGLLLGILVDSPTTASMWGGLLLMLLIGSALLKFFTGSQLPPAVQSIVNWLPGSVMLELFSISQAGEFPVGLLWLNVSAILIAIAAITILLVWRMRRMEAL